ncbi:MAG: DEAD/DEAH box helicase [Marinifilaceae bacterium]|jgi:ATP-dependent RNA helicase DeaD|nr:DEAD/DEAH box helicase [Marinifilaceae bacterium]
MNSFENLGLSKTVLNAISELGFEQPTAIQEKAIPLLLEAQTDFVGLAQTGTGKTAAYGLPLIELIDPYENTPQALILSPTRELGIQIGEDLKLFSKNIFNLKLVNVYGGANIDEQIRKIKRGAQIIVATPGRLLDLIKRKAINLSELEYLVLDEADEMLNMGFKDDIDEILADTPNTKLTWLFSATMPKEVRQISKNYMSNPQEVTIGKANTSNANISHQYYMLNNRDRYNVLKRVVDFYPDIYGIVFCRTRKETQEVAELLMKDGYNADALHGDLTQVQRDRVMRNFKNKSLQLLIATDVAARGIDVDNLSHVIHYNLPDELEFYTHRSGRTARAGNKGISIALITPREERKVKELARKLKTNFDKTEIPVGKKVCERQLFSFMDKVKQVNIDEEEIAPFIEEINTQLDGIDKESLIKRFVSLEFNRFWEYYKNSPDLNIKANQNDRRDTEYRRPKNSSDDRLFINIGKKDGIDVPKLLNIIHKQCNVRGKDVGRIDLKGVFSFFEVNKKFTDEIIKGFAGSTVCGRKVRIEISNEMPSNNSGRRDSGRSKRRFDRSDRPNGGNNNKKPFSKDNRKKGPRRESRYNKYKPQS